MRLNQQNASFKKLAETNTGFIAYQIKGLSNPPVGINSNEIPTVSVKTRLLIAFEFFEYLAYKFVTIPDVMNRMMITTILKRKNSV